MVPMFHWNLEFNFDLYCKDLSDLNVARIKVFHKFELVNCKEMSNIWKTMWTNNITKSKFHHQLLETI